MDQRIGKLSDTQIILESYSSIALDGITEKDLDKEVLEYLLNRKDRKLMSKQDKLALVSAAKAWRQYGKSEDVADRTGIYFCVGILPFEDRPLDKIAQNSQEDGEFNYQKFSDDAFNSMNPLLTFKCLPNMPLFHISYNLGITGRYVMTYPGHQDLFESIIRAVDDLEAGLVDHAIVGVACDQNNFLVQHHLQRSQVELKDKALDCSATIILSKRSAKDGDLILKNIQNNYTPNNPFEDGNKLFEGNIEKYYGAAQIFFELIKNIESDRIEHKWSLSGNETTLNLEHFHG